MINAAPVDIVFTHRASPKLRTPTPTPPKNNSLNYVSADAKVIDNNSISSSAIMDQFIYIMPILSLFINMVTLLLVVGMIMAK